MFDLYILNQFCSEHSPGTLAARLTCWVLLHSFLELRNLGNHSIGVSTLAPKPLAAGYEGVHRAKSVPMDGRLEIKKVFLGKFSAIIQT